MKRGSAEVVQQLFAADARTDPRHDSDFFDLRRQYFKRRW
jgi:hypothetical protein